MEQSRLVELYMETFIQQTLTDALPHAKHCAGQWRYNNEHGMLHVQKGLTAYYSSRVKIEMVEVVEVGTMSQSNSREKPQPSLEGPGRQRYFRESG